MVPSSKKRDREEATAVSHEDFPCRDCRHLFAAHETVYCALHHGCIPCAYKVGCFDVALDADFTRAIPNQRPEACKRSKGSVGKQGTLGYKSGTKTLTVGDGDFSFSLAVARILSSGSASLSLLATSYESRETLEKVYPNVEKTISELEDLGATVCFYVDATKLKTTLPSSNVQFDRIVWNFPCEAVAKGQDGQNDEMEKNKDLVRQFVAGARHLLAPGGQVHLNHKTKPPFDQWMIQEVAVAASQSDEPIMSFAGRIVFDRYLLPPYIPRKALHRKSFPSHDACTYVFVRKDAPSLRSTNKVDSSSTSLIAVTRSLIGSIRVSLLKQRDTRQTKRLHTGKKSRDASNRD